MENIIGKRFSRLVVVEERPTDKAYGKYSGRRLLVKCDCGNIKSVNRRAVIRGRVQSCGCLKPQKKHGLSSKKIYSSYRSMLQRCYDQSHWLYHRYGGRGITVCDEWLKNIEVFYNWAMENGYRKGLTIDRINNDLGYSPDNCHFVTLRQNLNNTSKTIFVYIKDKKLTLQAACKKYNIDPSVVYQRIYKLKWDHEKAVKTPVRPMKKRKPQGGMFNVPS